MLAVKTLLKKTPSMILRNDESLQDESLFWLLGRPPADDTAILILRRKKTPVLFVSELELGNYERCPGVIVKKLTRDDIKKEFKSLRGTVGVNQECMTAAQAVRWKKSIPAKMVDIAPLLAELRAVKTPAELQKIKAACKLTAELLATVPQIAPRCKTERELALRLERAAVDAGAQGLAFETIVASGPGSAIPHYKTAAKKIAPGFLIVDFGVRLNGYCSDLTRTFFVGSPTVYHKHIIASVFNAKDAATKACIAGAKAKDVHNAADAIIKQNFQKPMIHSIGHGLGLRTHDFPPALHGTADFKLMQNMVVTIEPGQYIPGTGGVRIEDVVVVKKNKCLEFTRADRGLETIQLQ